MELVPSESLKKMGTETSLQKNVSGKDAAICLSVFPLMTILPTLIHSFQSFQDILIANKDSKFEHGTFSWEKIVFQMTMILNRLMGETANNLFLGSLMQRNANLHSLKEIKAL